MGLGSLLSRKPSRKSRDSGVYYYNSAGSQTYDSRYSTPDSNRLAAYHAATAATGASRVNSMTSLSGAAAQAALNRHSASYNTGVGNNHSLGNGNGRTMSLSSRTFRSPNATGASSNIRRSNSYQGSRNPYLQQKQKQHFQQQNAYRPNGSRLNSISSNSARPYSRANSINSNSSRLSTGGTKTTTTTTTRTTSHTPDGQSYTTITKTTKEKDFDGRTRSITKTTVQQRGDVEIVKKTVIKPTSYVGAIAEEHEINNPEDETFDDDFYQEPEVDQELVDDDHLEDIKEEPSHIYDDNLYDVYLDQGVSPEHDALNQKNNIINQHYSNPLAEQKQLEPQLQVSPTPILQESRGRHSYHMLTKPQLGNQLFLNRLEKPPVLSQSSSLTSSPKSILKSSPVRYSAQPLSQPNNGNDEDEDDDDDENEKFSDAVQTQKRKSMIQNIGPSDSSHDSFEKITEDIPSSRSSSRIPPSTDTNYRSSMKQLVSNTIKPGLLPAFNTRSNSLTSNTGSTRKQVKIANTPRSVHARSSSVEQSPQQSRKKPTDQEMYELAYKAAMKNVYGDREAVQSKTQQHGMSVQESQTQYPFGDNTIEVELDEDTQRNTLMNTGSKSISLNSKNKTAGRTMSMSSHTSSSQYANTQGYQSNAAGVGFMTHSLRDMPDQKAIKKQKEKQAKEQAKADAKLKKQLEKQRKDEAKRLIKERSEAVKKVESEAVKTEEDHLQEHGFIATDPVEAPTLVHDEQSSSILSPVIKNGTPNTTPASSIPVELNKREQLVNEPPQQPRVTPSSDHAHNVQASPSTTLSSKKRSRKLFGFSKKSNKKSVSSTNNTATNEITVALPTSELSNDIPASKLPPSLASNPNSASFVKELNNRDSELRRASVQLNDKVGSNHKTKGRKFMEFFNL